MALIEILKVPNGTGATSVPVQSLTSVGCRHGSRPANVLIDPKLHIKICRLGSGSSANSYFISKEIVLYAISTVQHRCRELSYKFNRVALQLFGPASALLIHLYLYLWRDDSTYNTIREGIFYLLKISLTCSRLASRLCLCWECGLLNIFFLRLLTDYLWSNIRFDPQNFGWIY